MSRKIGLSVRHQVGERVLRQLHQRQAEELLGGGIGEAETVVAVEQQHRHRQRREQSGMIRLAQRTAPDHGQYAAGQCVAHYAASASIGARAMSGS